MEKRAEEAVERSWKRLICRDGKTAPGAFDCEDDDRVSDDRRQDPKQPLMRAVRQEDLRVLHREGGHSGDVAASHGTDVLSNPPKGSLRVFFDKEAQVAQCIDGGERPEEKAQDQEGHISGMHDIDKHPVAYQTQTKPGRKDGDHPVVPPFPSFLVPFQYAYARKRSVESQHRDHHQKGTEPIKRNDAERTQANPPHGADIYFADESMIFSPFSVQHLDDTQQEHGAAANNVG